jgi:predicted short-subunit dehydrogenase-like oxidoreductase (DUF2520 family)
VRELERDPSSGALSPTRLAIVGRGRLGTALAASLAEAAPATLEEPAPATPAKAPEHSRFEVIGPLGRDADPAGAHAVLLCVPDEEITNAAASIAPGPLVGHCSGATRLEALSPHEAFSLHPLMTVTGEGASFEGAGAAIAGSTPRALQAAKELAEALRMRPVEIAEKDRTAYHAAASIASNFLVTLEAGAERLAATAGLERELLVPLVGATVSNWAALGAERALTGPVARGDEKTVSMQRTALAERVPDLVPLFDALVEATRSLAHAKEAHAL